MERNGPSIFMPISVCAGTDLKRNISRKLGALAGLGFVGAHLDNPGQGS
jgi:hypothetical protein